MNPAAHDNISDVNRFTLSYVRAPRPPLAGSARVAESGRGIATGSLFYFVPHISGFLFVSVHVYGIDPPKHVLLSGLGFHVIDRMEFLMWNRNVEIDRTHIRAICNEIGERLRISLSGEIPELSLQMRRQLDQLRELDEDASPSIVPAKGQF